jgi:hypothetical protein
MQETPEFARLTEFITPEVIKDMAALYDGAVNSLDPHSSVRAQAEQLFNEEIRGHYDLIVSSIPPPLPEFRDFRRAVIVMCRRHLKAADRHTSI